MIAYSRTLADLWFCMLPNHSRIQGCSRGEFLGLWWALEGSPSYILNIGVLEERLELSVVTSAATLCKAAQPTVEHGVRARPDAQWAGIPLAHGDRSMESRERVSKGQLPAHRRVRRQSSGRGGHRERLTPGHQGRQVYGVHLQDA